MLLLLAYLDLLHMASSESNPIKSINVMHLEKTNSTDISAIITVTLYKETVADYVLFIEYRTQANKNHWTLLEVVLGESVFEVHNLSVNISYQLRLSYSIAWQTPCGGSDNAKDEMKRVARESVDPPTIRLREFANEAEDVASEDADSRGIGSLSRN
uniref:Fibronectin type-III domain-containing protein n=1 Tax=Ascaris lumbricoides TaxID=6252 RepID=A0A0M3HMR9_ASCLU